jgi:hypothetical protein
MEKKLRHGDEVRTTYNMVGRVVEFPKSAPGWVLLQFPDGKKALHHIDYLIFERRGQA